MLLLLPVAAFSQEDEGGYVDETQIQVDSILSLIAPSSHDSIKAKYYGAIGEVSNNPDTVLKYSFLSLDLCDESDLDLMARCYAYIRWAYYMVGKERESLDYSFKALQCFNQLGKKREMALMYISMGKAYHDLNIKDSTFYYLNKGLDIYIEEEDTANISYTYHEIGVVNSDLGFYETAREYFAKSIYLDSLFQDYLSMATTYIMQSSAVDDLHESLRYLTSAAQIFDTIPTDDGYYINNKYNTYQSLADIYIKLAKETSEHKYADSCYLYIKKVGTRSLDFGEYEGHVLLQLTYADYLLFVGKAKEALPVLLDCQQYMDDADDSAVLLSNYYTKLAKVYKELGDYKNALECTEKNHVYELSYVNDSTMNTIADFKAEEETIIQRAENKALVAEKDRLNTIVIALVGGLVLIVALIFFIIRALRIKQKANQELVEKNYMLDTQNCEIMAQRDEIECQRDEIESQKEVITKQWHEVETVNKKLFQSINYAQRIQTAAISQKNEIDAVFPECFVYYRPRDIVSGDYYKVAKCGKYHVMIVADCTGHGIPGGFLSMLGISALKEYCTTEQDAANPGIILDNMRNFIKTTLVSSVPTQVGDGMEMTICSFDFDAMELRYASANQNACLVRRGEPIKLKGDRMPVGRYFVEKEHFTTFTLPIEKGDMVYMYSDGIQDQPGGDSSDLYGKKFLSKNLVALLVDMCDKPIDTQCDILDKSITRWRNARPQVDDMTLVGIRV
ncbi:MAG: SpoIIE family protein phosphatase [Bacteroidales bacterium]|nr:SpoIIE family protein phosphatase [Bacteroidales bacterium]